MPQRYVEAILKSLAGREYQPLKPRQLARQMGVAQEDYGTFRQAVKRLRDAGRVVLGDRNALTLPEVSSQVVGFFRANPKGFGFVVPETPNAHGDVYIPPEATGGAMTGDEVLIRVRTRSRRGGETVLAGQVQRIIQRGQNRFVGTLQQAEGNWFVLPDGRQFTTPVVVRDIGAAGPKAGTKVVVEITQYPQPGDLPSGVIVESLGAGGPIEVETLAVIRAHGLAETFPEAALAEARAAGRGFDPTGAAGREDLTGATIVTIDPDDARDFDDAISLSGGGGGTTTLGVQIADLCDRNRDAYRGYFRDADAVVHCGFAHPDDPGDPNPNLRRVDLEVIWNEEGISNNRPTRSGRPTVAVSTVLVDNDR